jgi:hypothetical protein
MAVPTQYQTIYNSAWERFADLVPKYLESYGCCPMRKMEKIYMEMSFLFLRSADIVLNQGDLVSFSNFINSAYTILNRIRK